jgi:transposase
MKLHANARTCPNSRRLIVRRIEDQGWSLAAAAEAAGVSERTAAKWLARWRAEGTAGLADRSSAPRARPTQLAADRVRAIEALRRLRMTAAEIAECLSMALSTVSRWLRRIGLGRLTRLEPPEPPNR